VDAVLKDIGAAADVTVKRMEYFAMKLEMKGIGEGIVKRMYTGGIDSIPKMLAVTEADLLKLDGFQAKSAAKVVKEIRDAVQRADCLTFMHASNLFGRAIGSTKLKAIVAVYPKILEGQVPTEAQVAGISGIGPITARQFLDALPGFFEFMDEIGVPCTTKAKPTTTTVAAPPPPSTKSLVGQAFVFTGIRDKELEASIEARGGKIASAVSGKTTVVIAKNPADQTGKVKEAIERGIPVVDIETFKKNYL
jgi:DNA ligase (NAD+)